MLVLLVCGAVARRDGPPGWRIRPAGAGEDARAIPGIGAAGGRGAVAPEPGSPEEQNELPLELNVSSIAAQYELNGTAEARPFFIAPNPSNSNIIFKTFTSILPDLNVSGANRPTITLVPADNGETVRRFLTLIPTPTFLAFLSEKEELAHRGGASALGRAAHGVPNGVTASGSVTRGLISEFQRFRRLTELIQYAQDHELVSIRHEQREKRGWAGRFPRHR